MIATINIEKVKEMMEKALTDYAKREKNIMSHCINAGVLVGVFNMIQELDGFPKEKIEEYRLRIEGIGELLQMR